MKGGASRVHEELFALMPWRQEEDIHGSEGAHNNGPTVTIQRNRGFGIQFAFTARGLIPTLSATVSPLESVNSDRRLVTCHR